MGVDAGESVTAGISVCVANYNGVGVVERCLASVLAQETETPIELIVLDDASTDESVRIIKEQFPQVTLIAEKQNLGFAEANNRMATLASHEFMLLLNNDAYLESGALQALYLESQNSRNQILSLRQVHWDDGELIDRGMGLDFLFVPFPIQQKNSKHLITAIGACLWLPRDLFLDIGGFPAWFGSIGEDLYLCLAARLRGIPTRVLDEKRYFHWVGYSFTSSRPGAAKETSYRRRHLSERNRFWLMMMILPSIAVPVSILCWVVIWMCEAIFMSALHLSLKPLSEIYFLALRDTFRVTQRIRSTRKALQLSRTISWRFFFAPMRLAPTKVIYLLRRGAPGLR